MAGGPIDTEGPSTAAEGAKEHRHTTGATSTPATTRRRAATKRTATSDAQRSLPFHG